MKIVRSASPSSSAGPDTIGPQATSTVGMTPEARTSSRAARAQAAEPPMPSSNGTPVVLRTPTKGSRFSTAVRIASVSRAPSPIVSAGSGPSGSR